MNRINYFGFGHFIFTILLSLSLTGVVASENINDTSLSSVPPSGLAFTTDVGIIGCYTPAVAEMGQPFSAVIEVINQGPAAAEGIQIDYYLVRSNETDARPIWVHQKTADIISPFHQDDVSFTIDLPGGIAPGAYALLSTINSTTIDRNLTNNQYLSNTPIVIKKSILSQSTGLADLSVSIDSISSNGTAPGYPFTINYTVFNTGNTSTGTFHVGFYLSQDPNIEPSDLRVWDEIYYSAYPGMAEPGVSTDLLPVEIPKWVYY
ncbi:MAG: hypothetical protein V1862_05280, partial [Methanobacteriota archaeon]